MISSPKIYDMQNPSTDTISEIAFSKLHPMMLTCSWDGSARLYNPTNTTGFINTININKPLLSCCFSSEAQAHAFAAGPDGNLHFLDLEKNTFNSLKAHEEGIKSVRYFNNTVITGSWDKTIKFWDVRSAQVTYTIQASGKVYCMDLENNLLSFGSSGNEVTSILLDNIEDKKVTKPRFSYMMKSLACGFDNKSVIIGGIEGKCELINITACYGGMLFRSHRKGSVIYSVNTVAITPFSSSVLVTGGSNGELFFYDSVSRLKTFSQVESNPITSGKFNYNGKLYAYATGNDWSCGYDTIYRPVGLKVIEVESIGIKVTN